MNNISCKVIKDLLPLYHDKVCSDDSKKIVEEHLTFCENCQRELKNIDTEIKIAFKNNTMDRKDTNVIKNISKLWKKSKVKSFIKGLIYATLFFAFAAGIYIGLFRWNIINVSTDVIKITDVCRLSDGRIAYHVKLIDGYILNQCNFNTDKKGNFYVKPVRSVIKQKQKKDTLAGLADMYYDFNPKEKQSKALYWGTYKDNILIWKEDMPLPKASQEVEDMFNIRD